MADLVTGMFLTRGAAERAVADLQGLGYGQGEISVMMGDQTRAHQFAAEGAGIGGMGGGLLGGLIGAGVSAKRARVYEATLYTGIRAASCWPSMPNPTASRVCVRSKSRTAR